MNIQSHPTRSALRHVSWASNCSSVASSQSSRSGEGGGKFKHRFGVLTRSLSLDLRRPAKENHGRDYKAKLNRRGSMPTIDQGAMWARARSKVPSKQNEAWDCLDKKAVLPKPKIQHTLTLNVSKPASKPEPCSISTIKTFRKKNQRVSFDESVAVIGHEAQNLSWYTASEVEQFSKDAENRAMAIDRTMKYVSTFEVVTMGLTAPQVLAEYLATPSDVVGVEQLLSGQRAIRKNLQVHHAKVLLEEQRRRKDPEILASRLQHTSKIAANMAQKRADYTLLVD